MQLLVLGIIMGRMAKAAKEGGAMGIRANTKEDIAEIKKNVELPIIGIVKRDYPDSQVYITPTMKYVFEQAKKGDRDCIKAIEEMCDILGMGIANICYVINPEVVVLGGGIMEQKEYLRELLEKSIRRYLLPTVAKHTRWEFACHENHAGMIGAFCHFKRKKETKYN